LWVAGYKTEHLVQRRKVSHSRFSITTPSSSHAEDRIPEFHDNIFWFARPHVFIKEIQLILVSQTHLQRMVRKSACRIRSCFSTRFDTLIGIKLQCRFIFAFIAFVCSRIGLPTAVPNLVSSTTTNRPCPSYFESMPVHK